MADNQRTQVQATIRRAMQAAQRATNELDAQAMQELADLYQAALVEIQFLISHAADELGQVRLSQLHTLTRQIEEILNQVNQKQSSMVEGYIVEAAKNGGNTFSSSIPAAKVSGSIDAAVLAARTMQQKDGLQLSDRLWRVHRNAKQELTNAVERAVILGQSASEAAQDYQRRMQPVPSNIAQQMSMASSSGINKKVSDVLMEDQGAPYHQIKRVMITEIYRAHDIAFQNSAFEHDFVAGVQFTLGSNHPKRDICDMHATVNLYGLGKGVYPKGKSPYPAHPSTRCFHLVVFWDEVTEEDKAGATTRIDWLKSQSQATQKAVLGHNKKVSALQQGHLTQGMIATPWKHLEPVLKRKGIDTASL
ncbi:hypothetical protein DC365_00485 [Vibrio vulnificus]|uniref:hypothetical protein n=1 Tax=Vibrio vulnificus TaxID=672 RepID=UPI000D3E5BE7|nr:hypothetical protein [Vibrio vulnificus]PVA00556.1 hypothetical protein DC365_00485 [Vibrio vulnificus]